MLISFLSYKLMFWIKLLNFKLKCHFFWGGLLKPIVLMVENIGDIKGEQLIMKVGKICGAWCYDQWA